MDDDSFSVFFLQHQLSTARAECESNTKEIGQHELTVNQKEEKIETLSQQLQEKEALIAKLEQELAVAREAGAKQELEHEQGILKATVEAAELRDKLKEAEEGKWKAMRRLETAQTESKWLQSWMTELGEKQTIIIGKVSSIRSILQRLQHNM